MATLTERIVANLTGKSRRVAMHGREYVVAPVTMIVPGVLNGSRGPLYYPLEEIERNYSDWNSVPIVVYHPVANGTPVSARDPDIIGTQGIGSVYRAQVNGKLVAEGWFDVAATKLVDNRVLAALEKGTPIELSTGLIVDTEDAPEGAVHNGVAYTHIARNYKPDHLAVLPDQVGACSLKDGCGVLVNEDTSNTSSGGGTMNEAEKKAIVDKLITNGCCWKETDREALVSMSDVGLKNLEQSEEKRIEAEAVANAAKAGFKTAEGVEFTYNTETKAWDQKPEAKKPETKGEEKVEKQVDNEKPVLSEQDKEDLAFARQIKKERKDTAITKITANKRNKFTKEQLEAMSLDVLNNLAELATEEVGHTTVNYTGAAGATSNVSNDLDHDDILPLPVMNYKDE